MSDPLPDILIGFVAFLIVAAVLSMFLNDKRKPRANPHVYDGIRPISPEQHKRLLASYERSKQSTN